MRRRIIITIMLITSLLTGCRKEPEQTAYQEYKTMTQTENAEKAQKTDYVGDTCYSGEDVPYYLFTSEFGQTEDYVRNKDLVSNLNDDEINGYIETTKSYIEILFNNNYRTIQNAQDDFLEDYAGFYPDGSVILSDKEDTEVKDAAQKMMEWYVDNRATMSAEYVSGKCMLYKDGGLYFLRGSLELTVISDQKGISEFNKLYGNVLDKNGVGCVIIETIFSPSNSNSIVGVSMVRNTR